MRTVAAISTDDLVNSLLDSVTSGSSSKHSSDATLSTSTMPSVASAWNTESPIHSSSSSTQNDVEVPDSVDAIRPAVSPAPTGADSSSKNSTNIVLDQSDGGDLSAGLYVVIVLGILALVLAAVLFYRSRQRHARKDIELADSPTVGAAHITVPSDRGFKRERELGMPEMSIELTPGDLGRSKGFDTSYVSSTRSSNTAQQYNLSLASNGDGSVFNTKGGVSPTGSHRKVTSYSYQYSESEDSGNPHVASAGSTTFHLTGLIGSGAAVSGRGRNNISRSRKLSAPDEYAELTTATNAQGQIQMHESYSSPHETRTDLTQSSSSSNELDISMGPDDDNHSFLGPLPTHGPPAIAIKHANLRASDESMGPDSPITKRGKHPNLMYDTVPFSTGNPLATSQSSMENFHDRSSTSVLSASSVSSISNRDSMATAVSRSAYVASVPLLQHPSTYYGEDLSSERASTESTDSANTTRSGSLIALDLKAKGSCSEIAI
ncbi:hypothetical protein CCR75_007780 [Bremia lactucae]|uniref:Uncharacterized protein n=1 Tax=Bremia lactucae TaxID=4779 RepID=A0A976NYK0_BRELC|nr:hypothetical protein CCR75_007780 [Bremia lactucae]